MTSNHTVQLGSNDWRDQLISELKRTGGDPSVLFELLEYIVKERAWETLLDTEGQPVGSFRRLIEAPAPTGCGQKADKVLKLLDVEHRYERENKEWHERMTILRNEVRILLGADIPTAQTSGTNRHTSSSDMSELGITKQGGNSKDYAIALLKRDAPDLAEQVISGEISAAEGKRRLVERKGQPRPVKVTVNMADLDAVVKQLVHHLTSEQIRDLVNRLDDYLIED